MPGSVTEPGRRLSSPCQTTREVPQSSQGGVKKEPESQHNTKKPQGSEREASHKREGRVSKWGQSAIKATEELEGNQSQARVLQRS
ncbi:hypothetical protein Zmor_026313 [Zophobas morio]|uniref:Uncharacterized protein n=1 Tax=Zophobas morio TaxID=2755281 RepID=A0AA38M5V5_9CUCU|nr:hypothetical protein Zmor_026313 [Zophobas morio]